MIKAWQQTDERQIGDFRIFTLSQVTRISPRTQNEHNFFVLNAPDWINIIPITATGNVIFIKQYRHGTGTVCLEVPGGMVDPHEDDPMVTARREMLEETGFSAEKIIHLGTVEPNPAFLTNRCHTYLALNATYVQPPEFDGAEDIEMIEVPLTQVLDLILAGKITHSLTICAFFFFNRWRERNRDAISAASDMPLPFPSLNLP